MKHTVCQSGKFISDQVHHRARGLGGMIKKIVTTHVVHVMDLICLYLS